MSLTVRALMPARSASSSCVIPALLRAALSDDPRSARTALLIPLSSGCCAASVLNPVSQMVT
jgi:membrane-associated PAP2 superfamily phosphatase